MMLLWIYLGMGALTFLVILYMGGRYSDDSAEDIFTMSLCISAFWPIIIGIGLPLALPVWASMWVFDAARKQRNRKKKAK